MLDFTVASTQPRTVPSERSGRRGGLLDDALNCKWTSCSGHGRLNDYLASSTMWIVGDASAIVNWVV